MNELLLLALLPLLALDLLTEATHAGLLNARSMRLLAMRTQMEGEVTRTLALLTDPVRLRESLRFTQGAARALVIGIAAYAFLRRGDPPAWQAAGLALLVGIGLWVVEYLVEWWVLRDPETWALRLTWYAQSLTLILTPLLALPMWIFRYDLGPEKPIVVSEDELKTLVDASQQEGVLEQDEREMIYSIFRFGDTLAREIMVPRIDVFALPVETAPTTAVDALLESGFSRVPVYEDSIDNVAGLLYAKDLLQAWREGNHLETLRDLLRPPYFIPETKKVDELLTEMQAQRVHMAIVVDEYGGTAGIVTLEDIIEEIMGEIQDEYDQGEELPYQQLNDEEYLFHGRIDLDDFNVIMDTELTIDEADTLGGLIYSRIGRVPKGGERLEVGDVLLTIEQVTGRRIRKVRARRRPLKLERGLESGPPDSQEEEHAG